MDCWKDPWVPWLPNFIPKPRNGQISTNPFLVSNLINQESKTWRLDLLEDLFDADSVVAVKKVIILTTPLANKLVWIADQKGIFSVKSAYKIHSNLSWPPNPDLIWQKLWKSTLHELEDWLWYSPHKLQLICQDIFKGSILPIMPT